MESQPHKPEFRNNPENFHPCFTHAKRVQCQTKKDLYHLGLFQKKTPGGGRRHLFFYPTTHGI